MADSDARDALQDMVKSLQGTFQRYNRSTRKKAWQALSSSEGKAVVNQLADNPGRPVRDLPRLLRFKEWFYSQEL